MKNLGKINNVIKTSFLLWFIDNNYGNIKKVKFLNSHSNRKLEDRTKEEFIETSSLFEIILFKSLYEYEIHKKK
jgi:hypothetical protein